MHGSSPSVLGIAATVSTPHASWSSTSGFADLTQNTELDPCDRFHLYSVTKVFTATLVLKLVEDEQLSLNSPLSTWYPRFPNAYNIHVAHLLSHTSGLFDYLGDANIRNGAFEGWSPDAILERAAAHPAAFLPGQRYQYSNTNYIALGRIIEHAGGASYAEMLRTVITEPLGLRNTILDTGTTIARLVEGSTHTPHRGLHNLRYFHPSLAWSAGSIVATVHDVVRFAHALFSHHILGESLVNKMTTPFPLADGTTAPVGLGIGVVPTAAGPYYAHSGGGTTTDFHAWLGYLPKHNTAIAVSANTGTTPTGKIATELLRVFLEN